MKKCSKCGKEIIEGNNYCTNCGCNLSIGEFTSKENEEHYKNMESTESFFIRVIKAFFIVVCIIVFLGMISYMFLIVSCMSDCNSGNIKIPDRNIQIGG